MGDEMRLTETPRPSAAPVAAADALSPARRAAVDALAREALLDSAPEEAFDRLTRLASSLLGVPVALVSLVDEHRQFFKSALGLPEPWASMRETPISHSFCQHVVERQEPFIVSDARLDSVTSDNAAIDDIGVVAYAGFPIVTADNTVVGSLCAIDSQPRAWTKEQLDVLRELAGLAHTELVLRSALRDSDTAERAAMRATAERAAVIESSSDGIYTIDMDGRCTLVNSAAAALLGHAVESLIGMEMHALVHHHHADGRPYDEADCPLYHAFREGRTVRIDQTHFWRRDGSSLPVQCTSSPLIVEGAMSGAVVAFRDISQQIAAAEALRESEMRFRAVFEEAGVGIVITDLEGRLLECNEAYERVTGFPRAELLSTSFVHVTHPEDALLQRKLADEMLAGTREQLRMDKRYIQKNGNLIWARLTATIMRDAELTPRFIIGAVEDVTAARRSALAVSLLADAGAILSSSLENEAALEQVARRSIPFLGDACIVDLRREDGGCETLCVHVDPSRESALYALRSHMPLIPSDDPTGNPAPSSTSMHIRDLQSQSTGTERADLDALEARGVRWVLRAPFSGRHGVAGTLTFVSSLHRHSPEDARLSEELAARILTAVENSALYRRAQSATRARDDMLAVVSHDLRNPIHTITMAAALLHEIPTLDAGAVQSQIGVIRRSAARGERLIRDLMDITRMENGKLRLDLQSLAAADVLAEASQLAMGQAGERRIDLIVAELSEPLALRADRHRVLQALDNLLGNALKFTPAEGQVYLSAWRDGSGTMFEVRDTGPGVPREQQANLFTRFWQARVGDRRGVGLGLSIVKGIVDAHGGRIEVESDGASGTAIRFTIPAVPPEREAV